LLRSPPDRVRARRVGRCFTFSGAWWCTEDAEDAEILRRATALAETDADVLLVDGVRDAERSPLSVE
jgi:hypothetical protein